MNKKTKNIKRKPNVLVVVLSIVTAITIIFTGVNIVQTLAISDVQVDGKEKNKLTNDYYEIGNNATQLQKDIFKQLTDALNAKEKDDVKIADLVAQSFIADFFTWTNKDGNYEVGGSQYFYGPGILGFQNYSRDHFYKDLDLYITQYGKENLLEVNSIYSEASVNAGYTTYYDTYTAYSIFLEWTYKDSNVLDTSDFQTDCWMQVIKHEDGRFEVVEFMKY